MRHTTASSSATSAPQSVQGIFAEVTFNKFGFGNTSEHKYMLYEPTLRRRAPAPLLVLLHGCGQGANDFAAGTRMNEAAEVAGVFVLYPEQNASANALRCWHWYAPTDRADDDSDAALIAAITRHVVAHHKIDPTRVYVAGMSAGGAMAAVLARDYPELYAALGVHSGIPAGHARDLSSALRLMSNGPPIGGDAGSAVAASGDGREMRTIVFHGDKDTTVHPSNGQAIHAIAGSDAHTCFGGRSLNATTHPDAGQRGFTRSVQFGAGGVSNRELWVVHGAGHAWAGGSTAQRYTDALGPDASREMLRFFLQHRLNESPQRRRERLAAAKSLKTCQTTTTMADPAGFKTRKHPPSHASKAARAPMGPTIN